MDKIKIAKEFIAWVVLNAEKELPSTIRNRAFEAAFNMDHMCDEHENRQPDESDEAKPLTVGKLIERLSYYEPDAKVVAYTKCGPDPIGGVGTNGSGEVVLNGLSPVCEHLMDGGCTKI